MKERPCLSVSLFWVVCFLLPTATSSKLKAKWPASHLLLDGFGWVFPQGELGRVGQSLLHCQITQQVIALEVKRRGDKGHWPKQRVSDGQRDFSLRVYFKAFDQISLLKWKIMRYILLLLHGEVHQLKKEPHHNPNSNFRPNPTWE